MNKQGPKGIEWTQRTWNPVTGCNRGCPYCYARRIAERFNGTKGFSEGFKPTFHAKSLDDPKRLKTPSKIFTVSMGDLFGSWVPESWITAVLDTVRECPQHTFQFLTKNPQRYWEFEFPSNCWIGTSADNPTDAHVRSETLNIAIRDNFRFLSLEPLLGDVAPYIDWDGINWVIVGQQSGQGAKLPEDRWVENIIDFAGKYNVPVFVKSPLYARFPVQQWPEVNR